MARVWMMDRNIWAILLLKFSTTSLNCFHIIKFANSATLKFKKKDEPLFVPFFVCAVGSTVMNNHRLPRIYHSKAKILWRTKFSKKGLIFSKNCWIIVSLLCLSVIKEFWWPEEKELVKLINSDACWWWCELTLNHIY